MNSTELDKFLQEQTKEEKFIDSVLKGFTGDLNNMDPKTADLWMKILSRPGEKTVLRDDLFFMSPSDRISIFIHPRIANAVNITSWEHRHSFIELVYVYRGSCSQVIEGVETMLEEGDICILDTNVTHSIMLKGKHDIVVNCLIRKSFYDTAFIGRLSGNDLLSDFFIRAIYREKSQNNFIHFYSRGNEEIRQVIGNILCEYYDKQMCSDEVISSYMVILFSELLRNYSKDANKNHNTTLKHTKIQDIIQHMQLNYKEATLASTAQHFSFHPNYLSQAFKKLSGVGFKDFLQQIKLERAGLLLLSTDFTIDEIANDIGYSNINFFYKLFKNKYGLTPNEYRKKNQEVGF